MSQKNKEKTHILVISQVFYPEQFRINDMCCEWIRRGYRVTVLTGIPNYPQGKFYDGYGFFKKRKESWNGIEIIRIPVIPRGKNPIGLVLNYISFPVSGFFWKLFTKIKADYLFMFETSPMTQCVIGVWYAKKHKIPLYLYAQDLWPENVEVVTGIHSPIVIEPIQKMVDYIYKNCTEIFVTSPSFVKAVCNRKKRVPKEKVHYWPQYAEEFYIPMEKKEVEEIPRIQAFKVMFTGNVGYAQGLDILPKTAAILKTAGKEVLFCIVGEGRYLEAFKNEIKKLDVEEMFCMIPRQPAARIPELLAAGDAAFLSFMETKLFEMTIPAKLQSYMACGMPVIAAASGESRRVIEEADCGFCTPSGDEKALAQSVANMLECPQEERKRMGTNARAYFEKHFEKQKLMDEIEKYFGESYDEMRHYRDL